MVDWKAIPWEIRPVGGSAHPVLFVRTTSGQEACFGPVGIRGDIVFVPRRAIATLQEVMSIIQPALGIIESVYIIDHFRKN